MSSATEALVSPAGVFIAATELSSAACTVVPVLCAGVVVVGTATFLPVSDRVLVRGLEVFFAAGPSPAWSAVCAPPELDTVTPGATSTVDDEGDS
jgi:predicted DNA repair protein MutK